MEIITLVAGIVVGWVVGRMHLTFQIMKQTQHLLNKPLESLLTKDRPETSVLYTTISDKYVYLYNTKTEEFLCQAATVEETVSKAFKLGIIKAVAIVEHGNSLILVHRGVVVDESTDES